MRISTIFQSLVFVSFLGLFSGVSAQSGPPVTLPTNWHTQFPLTNWDDSRAVVSQQLQTAGITFHRNAADEFVWTSQAGSLPTESSVMFNTGQKWNRLSVYHTDQTQAATKLASWLTSFVSLYGTDYTEINDNEKHQYFWANENGVQVELVWYKQDLNFSLRAEFLKL
ncbi:MAG: hypothetical protein EBS07_04670 [Sphingobacteriia bacterium]|nr:hypothetical protein [Sphingobacteriia bacterium]